MTKSHKIPACVAVALLTGAVALAAGPVTSTPTRQQSGKHNANPDPVAAALIAAHMGEILLSEEGVTVAAKRSRDGRLKEIVIYGLATSAIWSLSPVDPSGSRA